MHQKNKRLGARMAYGLYALNLAIIIYFWLHGSAVDFGTSHGSIIALGRLAGLIAAYSVMWQFLLQSRIPFLENSLGRLEQINLHHWNGYVVISGIILHFSLLTIGYAASTHLGIVPQFMDFVFNYQEVMKALLAAILFDVVVVMSIAIVRRKLKYETWYFVHLATYLAILLAFSHQLKIGTDFIKQPLFAVYWWFLYILVFAMFLIFRVLAIVWRSYRWNFKVSRVVQEARGVYSIYISGRNIESFKYKAGQFAIWRFLSADLWWQAHPFSFSSHPGNGELRISVKGVGDYTSEIAKIKPGTSVAVDGPYGKFTSEVVLREKLVLIAGGIGLTPILSMLSDVAKEDKDAIVFYAAQTTADLALKEELEQYAKCHNIKLHYVISGEPGYSGLQGFVDREKLHSLVPDISQREVFLCGPPPMMDAVTKALEAEGVEPELIHTERFAF